MNVALHLMSVDEKFLLIRLMELYNYEFSLFSNNDINEYGYYEYDHINDYWNEEGRFPYLIRVDGKIAGFALICPHCNYRMEEGAQCIGEFFVMFKYRRMGIGLKVATQLLDNHRGLWEIFYWRNNILASRFLEKVVEKYTKNHYQICGIEHSTQIGFTFGN